jgi:mono/diheme cytochrome c family protein
VAVPSELSCLLFVACLPDSIGGSSDMPAFRDILSSHEMAAVLTYVKSSWPEDIRAIQWQQTAQDR